MDPALKITCWDKEFGRRLSAPRLAIRSVPNALLGTVYLVYSVCQLPYQFRSLQIACRGIHYYPWRTEQRFANFLCSRTVIMFCTSFTYHLKLGFETRKPWNATFPACSIFMSRNNTTPMLFMIGLRCGTTAMLGSMKKYASMGWQMLSTFKMPLGESCNILAMSLDESYIASGDACLPIGGCYIDMKLRQ